MIVVGWLPGEPGGSLVRASPALAPSVLYADRVTVICPHSDDALEMEDYFDLSGAAPGVVDFLALDSGYARRDETGKPPGTSDGSHVNEPLDIHVWQSLTEEFEEDAQLAIAEGRLHDAVFSIASLLFLADWGAYRFSQSSEAVDRLGKVTPKVVPTAARFLDEHRDEVRDEIVPRLLIGVFLNHTRRPIYALLDDVRGALASPTVAETGREMDMWARVRSSEAALATAVLRKLPSPADKPWDVIADVRSSLHGPLRRFRTAMARLSPQLTPPFHEDHVGHVEHVWRTEVVPALDELDELVRESSLRSVFFSKVAGDLKAYAGPVIGLATALESALPTLASAAIAAATPAVATIAKFEENRRAVDRHEFLFLREVRERGCPR